MTIEELIYQNIEHRECNNPLDYVFALLGICQTAIFPQYGQTMEELILTLFHKTIPQDPARLVSLLCEKSGCNPSRIACYLQSDLYLPPLSWMFDRHLDEHKNWPYHDKSLCLVVQPSPRWSPIKEGQEGTEKTSTQPVMLTAQDVIANNVSFRRLKDTCVGLIYSGSHESNKCQFRGAGLIYTRNESVLKGKKLVNNRTRTNLEAFANTLALLNQTFDGTVILGNSVFVKPGTFALLFLLKPFGEGLRPSTIKAAEISISELAGLTVALPTAVKQKENRKKATRR